jgi:hypothetical protein
MVGVFIVKEDAGTDVDEKWLILGPEKRTRKRNK